MDVPWASLGARPLLRDEVEVDPRYSYWAWLPEGKSSPDDAREVIRTWKSPEGLDQEQTYTPDSGWKTTWTYQDVRDQHKRGHLLPITEEDVRRHQERLAERERS